jgi:hypothetical protein
MVKISEAVMAKRGRPAKSTEDRIEAFAEDLGRLLGAARAKADHWLGQRQAISKSLIDIRDTASKLLAQLGHQAEAIARRRGRPRKEETNYVPAPVSRKKRRKMSPAARAKISAAQKKRWAKVKKAAQ